MRDAVESSDSPDLINCYLVRHGDTGDTVITAFRNVLTAKQIDLLAEHPKRYPQDQIRPVPNDAIPATVADRITDALNEQPGNDVAVIPVQLFEINCN